MKSNLFMWRFILMLTLVVFIMGFQKQKVSKRDGNIKTLFARIQNLERVKVVVK